MVTLEKARHEVHVFSNAYQYSPRGGMVCITVWPTLGKAKRDARMVNEAGNGLSATVHREY